MPKKPTMPANKSAKPIVAKPVASKSEPAKSTSVRNSPIPKLKSVTPANREITNDLIAEHAYFISISGNGGSPDDNWLRAERELRSR